MRLIPVLTAILVMLGLYAIVFERDALLAFARGDETAKTTPESADTDAGQVAQPDKEDVPGIGVVVKRSQAQTINNAVLLRGQTKAARQVEVRAETTATVISEPRRKGASVQAGDLLCELDPGTRMASLAEARARLSEAKSRVPETEAKLEEAKARLDEAMINFNAASKLKQDGYASETRLVSAQAAVRSAEAGIASAKSGLETTQSGIEGAAAAVAAAEREIERLRIVAPFAGLLESDTAELGSLLQPGALCATVIQLNPIKLVGFVPETEVNRVYPDAEAGARLVTGETVAGKVTFISRSSDPTTRTFQVEIEVPNPDLSIRDGQTATIMISSKGAKAHRLPQSALTLNNEGQLGVRVVGPGNVVEFAPVKLLRDEVGGVWVSGLPEQADVIVMGQDFVTAGVKVTPTYSEAEQ
ncbi:efflux RND transporter periplasmic adaptor subunit [Arenibacterium sp. CAU 1754]